MLGELPVEQQIAFIHHLLIVAQQGQRRLTPTLRRDGRWLCWPRQGKAVLRPVKGEGQGKRDRVAIQTHVAERCTAVGVDLRYEFIYPLDH